MDDELDEEQRRKRRAGVGIDIEVERRQPRPANDQPVWTRHDDGTWEMIVAGEHVAGLLPNNDPGYEDWWMSNGVGTAELPEYGWEAVDFDSLEAGKRSLEQWWHHARNGEAYQPERPERPTVTHEAIDRDPWNAVALDLPPFGDGDPELFLRVATTARDLRVTLAEQAGQAVTPGQRELWEQHADRAETRWKIAEARWAVQAAEQPLSKAAIDYDAWAAVYQPIPPNADSELLRYAFVAAEECAVAVKGEPGSMRALFEPDGLGYGESRETNFARASERLDELEGLIAAHDLAHSNQLTDDNIAERVQQIIDNPEVLSDETLWGVLDAHAARRAAEPVQVEPPAETETRIYEATEPELERSERPAEPVPDAALAHEQAEAEEILYDRWTGQRISAEDGLTHSVGPSLGGMGR